MYSLPKKRFLDFSYPNFMVNLKNLCSPWGYVIPNFFIFFRIHHTRINNSWRAHFLFRHLFVKFFILNKLEKTLYGHI